MRITVAFVMVLMSLVCAGAHGADAPVVSDLQDVVVGRTGMNVPPQAREMLKQNGFVVVSRPYHRIFSPYIQEGLPPFVTTDSLHRTFHVIFEEQLKKVETAFAADVAVITKAMIADIARHRKETAITLEEDRDLQTATEFFLVARALLDGDKPGNTGKADDELRLILAAKGVQASPLFGYRMDYSQFKPRGFYTDTPTLQRYFRAMSWYGNVAFRQSSARETNIALHIAVIFSRNKKIVERWRKVNRTYTLLIAQADDLTPDEYATALQAGTPAQVHAALAKLRDPQINSMVPTASVPGWQAQSKGMRFFGKRYVPDGEAFSNLTDPAVKGRYWPQGLDAMAAMGSARATQLVGKEPGKFDRQAYAKGLQKSTATMKALMASKEPSHYVRTLSLIQTVLAPPPAKGAPPCMSTPAWTDKNLSSALAMWTSLRHAWVLQAKQSVTYMCANGGPDFHGLVEPNPPFYKSLHELIQFTIRTMGTVEGVDRERLEQLDLLVLELAGIARKQVENRELTEDEIRTLESYGPRIAGLMYFEGNSWISDGALPWMSLVVDVHTELQSGQCLQEATGPAFPIFVVVPHGGKLHLAVGGVYSHYEFKQPIAKRLTDAEWRRVCAGGRMPPRATWTSSFLAAPDEKPITEAIRKGELPEDAISVNTPAVRAALKRAIAPGGVFEGKKDLSSAVAAYGKMTGRKAMPMLLDYMRNLPEWKKDAPQGPHKRAYGATRALRALSHDGDIPLFEKMALGDDSELANSAISLIAYLQTKKAEAALVRIYKETKSARARKDALYWLHTTGSRDVTPILLNAHAKGHAREYPALLRTFSEMWAEPSVFSIDTRPRCPAASNAAQQEKYRNQVRKYVMRSLDSKKERPREEASKCAGAMRLEEAIPLLEKLAANDDLAYDALVGLVRIASVKSCAALNRCLKRPGTDKDDIADLQEGLGQLTARDVRTLALALDRYKRDHNKYPPDGAGQWEKAIIAGRYTALDKRRLDSKGRMCDMWGRPFQYIPQLPHDPKQAGIFSLGPNGKNEHGKGDDIASWNLDKK